MPITIILSIYFIISILTFIIYALDKRAAIKNTWRIKENTLHLLSLAGGWPGAFLAQNILRHKTKKLKFRIIFFLSIICNCLILSFILVPNTLLYFQDFISTYIWNKQ